MDKPEQVCELERVLGVDIADMTKYVKGKPTGNSNGLISFNTNTYILDENWDIISIRISIHKILHFSPIISVLADFNKLVSLNLSLKWNQPKDLTSLNSLEQLERLNIQGSNIQAFPKLGNMSQLRHLSLHSNEIQNIKNLTELSILEGLDLSYNSIQDVGPLTKLEKLKSLSLECNKLSDISPLSELKDLQHLELGGNNITDIAPLSKLKKLQHLDLEGIQIKDITPLKDLKNLTFLNLAGAKSSKQKIFRVWSICGSME